MRNEKQIKSTVFSLLSKYNMRSVTLDNLVYIIEEQGYEIIEYNLTDDATNQIMKKLGLTDCAKSRKAFTYKQGAARFVFIFEELSADEKMIALAHELGHIFCMHLNDGNVECSVDEEYEANEFTHYLLQPSIWMRFRCCVIYYKKFIIAMLIVAIIALISAIFITQAVQSRSYYGEYYITKSGEKYHKKDCIFIKNKTNVERLTEKAYKLGRYKPCQMCLPK